MGLVLTGCPVGAELDNPQEYDPANTMPVLTQTASAAASSGGAASTTAATTTAASTTGASTTGGAACDGVCDVDTAMTLCQGSVCHGQPGVATAPTVGGGLDLFTATRETDMVDAPATYKSVTDMENCPSPPELLINSANPGASLMITKLTGTYSCGTAMPQVGSLAAADQQCIIDWVTCVAGGAAASGALAGQTAGSGGSSGL